MRFLFNICLLLSLPIIAMDNNQERTTTKFTDDCFYKGCQGLILGSVVTAAVINIVGIPVAIAMGANSMIAGPILAGASLGCSVCGGAIGSLIALTCCMKSDRSTHITENLISTYYQRFNHIFLKSAMNMEPVFNGQKPSDSNDIADSDSDVLIG
jgi:hypothetical protein